MASRRLITNGFEVRDVRWIPICLLMTIIGCAGENTAPPPITQQDRDGTKQRLKAVGARVTAEIPECLYLSLRNTHVEIRELGGSIECDYKGRKDLNDFGGVSVTVSRHFLDEDEVKQFRDWLKRSLADHDHSVSSSQYREFKATLSRIPLRLVFTRKIADPVTEAAE